MNKHPEKARKGSREGFPEIFFPLELGHFLHLAGRKKKKRFLDDRDRGGGRTDISGHDVELKYKNYQDRDKRERWFYNFFHFWKSSDGQLKKGHCGERSCEL